jgi:hypothetical protein
MATVLTHTFCNEPVAERGQFKEATSMAAAESEKASETQASTPLCQEFQDTKCNVPHTMSLLCSSIVTSAGRKCKNCESYLCFGFTSTDDIITPDMQCILCNKLLLNCSIFPSKLQKHLEVTHSECISKEVRFLKWKLQTVTNRPSTMTKAAKINYENATVASTG